MRRILPLLFLLMGSSVFASPLRVEGAGFVDQKGSQVILRGVNVSGASKLPPFKVIRGSEDFIPLRGWGFNSIRLLFNWEAYEAEKDQYDQSYLDYYLNVIRWAGEHNLYVIVDIHQDAFSRYSVAGCGEGFPKWALPPDQVPAVPLNDKSCASWFVSAVADKDMHAAWTDFYANTWGVRDQYLTLIRNLTQAIAGEPNVVGIDLLNEPWGEEETELHQLYTDAAQIVREAMPDTILFLSPVALTSLGLKTSTLPRIDDANIAHATHFYDPGLITNSWTPDGLIQSAKSWKSIGESWGTPLFIGEFGAAPSVKDAKTYLSNIYDLLDQELYSGALWVYTPTWNAEAKDGWNEEDLSISDDKGKLRGQYTPRPFVEKTPGKLLSMKWSRFWKVLSFSYQGNASGEALEIMVPGNFKWQWGIASSRGLACQKADGNRLLCKFPAASKKALTKVTLFFR